MTVTSTTLGAALVTFLVSSGAHQSAYAQSESSYRVVASKESKFQEELDRTAADGYRLVAGDAAVQAAIWERATDGKRRSYVFARNVETFLKDKKLQPGYRLVAPTFAGDEYWFNAVFEKVDGDEQARDYGFVKAGSSRGLRKRFEEKGDGSSGAVAIAWGGTGVAAIFERGAEAKLGRIIASGNTGDLRQEVQSAAQHGQCLVDGDGVREAVYLFADCAGKTPSTYEVIATTKMDTFEQELNAAASRGLRLIPASLVSIEKRVKFVGGAYNYETVGVVAPVSDATPITYRVLGTVRFGTFERELLNATAAGFSLVAFTIGPKEQVAVLERAMNR